MTTSSGTLESVSEGFIANPWFPSMLRIGLIEIGGKPLSNLLVPVTLHGTLKPGTNYTFTVDRILWMHLLIVVRSGNAVHRMGILSYGAMVLLDSWLIGFWGGKAIVHILTGVSASAPGAIPLLATLVGVLGMAAMVAFHLKRYRS
jgi:hypothetical protein